MNRTKYFLSLIGAMAFLLGLAASSSAQEERTPLIRANPNPVMVPPGQTSGTTTLTWNGGKEHPYAEVWVRVDENDETFIVESGRGTRQATVELGKTYVFKLSDANVLLASVSVTAKQGAAPSSSFAGCWNIAGDGSSYFDTALCLKQEGDKVTSDIYVLVGTVTGNTLRFTERPTGTHRSGHFVMDEGGKSFKGSMNSGDNPDENQHPLVGTFTNANNDKRKKS